jgi:PEP-CTERM motif
LRISWVSHLNCRPTAAVLAGTVVIGAVNNWLISPELDFSQGGAFSFYTRTRPGEILTYDTYLEVRQSNNGALTNVGSTASDFGDFSTIKATVGSLDGSVIYPGNSSSGGSPSGFVLFTFSIAPTAGSGRIAFRYYAPDGGNLQGGYVGIDTVNYTAVPEPSAGLGILTLGGFGLIARRLSKSRKAKA